jgi:hypothetical protein
VENPTLPSVAADRVRSVPVLSSRLRNAATLDRNASDSCCARAILAARAPELPVIWSVTDQSSPTAKP